jgi:adenine-specific DNA-methyltransferase
LWKKDDVGSNRTSKNEMRELFPAVESFDTPKPTRLINRMLLIGTTVSKGDIVLDFFAGSGTTAHAVLDLNRQDGGNRRFILVQIPEPTGGPEFATIADICKERIRRAAKKLGNEDAGKLNMDGGAKLDVGFRVFKLASSNIRAWEPDRDNLAATLQENAEHLKADRTEQDILFELLLKLGLDLTVPIEAKRIAGKTVHSIGAGVLMVCLAERITAAEVEPLALGIADWHKQLDPAGEAQVVFRDSAFTRPAAKRGGPHQSDDVAKANLTAILQQHGLENVRSL